MPDLEHCRSCHRLIRWVDTERGKRMPIDPDPVPDGNVILISGRAHVLGRSEVAPLSTKRYQAHFRTCENARAFRPDDLARARQRTFESVSREVGHEVRPGKTCAVPSCGEAIRPDQLFCWPHYRVVPQSVRDALRKNYRPGQQLGLLQPSPEWRAALDEAIAIALAAGARAEVR